MSFRARVRYCLFTVTGAVALGAVIAFVFRARPVRWDPRLPAEVAQLDGVRVGPYVRRVSELPAQVQAAAAPLLGVPLDLADGGQLPGVGRVIRNQDSASNRTA